MSLPTPSLTVENAGNAFAPSSQAAPSLALESAVAIDLISTGIAGLDQILGGGLAQERVYLIEGEPGTGKTTVGLQFLMEGAKRGESVLYITLAETTSELHSVARSHGWSLNGIELHEVLPLDNLLQPAAQYSVFHPSEIEMGATTEQIVALTRKFQPSRLVLDSLSELQLLAESPLRYRRQVLGLKQFLTQNNCTVLLLDNRALTATDLQVRSIAHGVLTLTTAAQNYGAERRQMRVVKYRGMAFRGGLHDYAIAPGGLLVYPRLVAADSRVASSNGESDTALKGFRGAKELNPGSLEPFKPLLQVQSGLPELDSLLGGGLEHGTSTLISGSPGTGKSSLAVQFVTAAAARGESSALFLFEEAADNLLNRAEGLGLGMRGHQQNGLIALRQIDPAELSPGEFSALVCQAADNGAKMVVIDSMNGYFNAMPDERFLTVHLHELLTYLGQRGVVTLLIGVQQSMLGGSMETNVDISYLADNLLLLRYYEHDGEVRQAVSVLKKRCSLHERTIRRMTLSNTGIHIGEALRGFRGILTGVPVSSTSMGKTALDEAKATSATAAAQTTDLPGLMGMPLGAPGVF